MNATTFINAMPEDIAGQLKTTRIISVMARALAEGQACKVTWFDPATAVFVNDRRLRIAGLYLQPQLDANLQPCGRSLMVSGLATWWSYRAKGWDTAAEKPVRCDVAMFVACELLDEAAYAPGADGKRWLFPVTAGGLQTQKPMYLDEIGAAMALKSGKWQVLPPADILGL